jgi:hypothetical protein
MAILNKTGITNGGTIQAEHVTRTIDALTGVSTDTIVATGSFTGSFTGTLIGSASFATSGSRTISSSFATTASYALNAVGSGTEYMTLRLASGVITGVTSGSAIYIGTATTSSNIARVGVSLPFNCQIVSASVYLNSPVTTNCALLNGALNYAIDATPIKIANLSNLDPKTVFIDSKAYAIGYDGGTADRWINVSYTPNATATGQFILSADILIKKD